MGEQEKLPVLLELLFGEAAEAAQRGASPRLICWAAAFDAWLEERGGQGRRQMLKQSRLAWQRLLGQQRKMPWEFTPDDLAQHAAWLQAEGYALSTISNSLGILSNFYRWCTERKIDPDCRADFNPAAGVPRPKYEPYAGAKLLSRGEVQALLDTLRDDPTPLGKRELAFFLARLRMGAPLSHLRLLQWGQIEEEEDEAWVRWGRPEEGHETARIRIPEETWEAIQDWLRASGRLEGMQAESYVFAPLANPLQEQAPGRAEAWVEGRPLSGNQIWANLKLYGRLAGIAEEKLNLLALRRTATRLKLDEMAARTGAPGTAMEDTTGKRLSDIKAFLDSQEEAKTTKARLKRLPGLPADGAPRTTEPAGERTGTRREPPKRTGSPFQPREGLRHGFRAHSLPPEEVRVVLDEEIKGLGEEIEGLRALARELLRWQDTANREDVLRLGLAYTLAATRLATLIEAERRLETNPQKNEWVEAMLAMYDRMALAEGKPPVSEAIRKEAQEAIPELASSSRQLREEIAAARVILRRTLGLAQEAKDTKELLWLAEIYGLASNRLLRLLRAQGSSENRLYEILRADLFRALKAVQEELGLYI